MEIEVRQGDDAALAKLAGELHRSVVAAAVPGSALATMIATDATGDDSDVLGLVKTVLDYRMAAEPDEEWVAVDCWDLADVDEMLLSWAPRRLGGDPADWDLLPDVLVASLQALDRAGQLCDCSTVVELTAGVDEVRDDYTEVMRDPDAWGPTKRIFHAMGAGADIMESPEQVNDLMAQFNALSFEERGAILGLSDEPFDPRGSAASEANEMFELVAAVPLPPPADVVASAARVPIVAQLATVVDFYRDGRKLTQKGHPRLADANELVRALGWGDSIDSKIGDRTFKVRSAGELPELVQLMRWARQAGLVKLAKGTLSSTAKGRSFGTDPLADATVAFDALMAMGVIASRRVDRQYLSMPQVEEFLDESVPMVLLPLYVTGREAVEEALYPPAQSAVHSTFRFTYNRYNDREMVDRRISWLVDGMLVTLAKAGVVDFEPTEVETSYGYTRHEGGQAELTAFGRVALRALMEEQELIGPPLQATLTEATLVELLLAMREGDWSEPQTVAELNGWTAARSSADRVAEVTATLLSRGDDPGIVSAAFGFLALDPEDIADLVPVAELLASSWPTVRGSTRRWMGAAGLLAPSEILDPADPVASLHTIGVAIMDDPDEGMALLELAGDHSAQQRLFEDTWRDASEATTLSLDVIGSVAPSKVVAKAARKALFRHRSMYPH